MCHFHPGVRMIALAAIGAASALLVPRLESQNVTGRITGGVFDPSHAAVSEAEVWAEHLASSQTFKVMSNRTGLYAFPSLPIGEYRITAEHAGFARQVIERALVNVGETVRLDIDLSLGSVEQAVQVTARAPLLDVSGATAGITMQNRQISDLPINGRDYARFSLLTPGAVLRGSALADLTFNGLQTSNNQFSIDGIDATRVDEAFISNGSERGARLLTGSLDTISEFGVQSGDYSAEYGRAAGSYINIVTKSGTNDFHGAEFEFLRNDALDARNFFDGAKPPFRRNQFGGSAAGPIVFSHRAAPRAAERLSPFSTARTASASSPGPAGSPWCAVPLAKEICYDRARAWSGPHHAPLAPGDGRGPGSGQAGRPHSHHS